MTSLPNPIYQPSLQELKSSCKGNKIYMQVNEDLRIEVMAKELEQIHRTASTSGDWMLCVLPFRTTVVLTTVPSR